MFSSILVGTLVGTLVGLATGITSVFAYRAQREWEKKREAYQHILEALQLMKAANDVLYDAEICHRELNEMRLDELSSQWNAGKNIAYKYADIGSVDTNATAERILIDLRKALDERPRTNSMFEALDNDGAAVGAALRAIKAERIADARRSGFWR